MYEGYSGTGGLRGDVAVAPNRLGSDFRPAIKVRPYDYWLGGIRMGDVAEFVAYNAHLEGSRCRQIGGFIERLSTLGSQSKGPSSLRYDYAKTYCAGRESDSRSRLYIDNIISRRTECTKVGLLRFVPLCQDYARHLTLISLRYRAKKPSGCCRLLRNHSYLNRYAKNPSDLEALSSY